MRVDAAHNMVSGPANGSTVSSSVSPLDWEDANGATKYHLQVATHAWFGTKVVDVDVIDGSAYAVSTLAPNTTHYWRVNASNGIGTSANSAVWTFTTGPARDTTPPTVTGQTPAPNAAGVAVESSVTAIPSEPVQPSTITAVTFTLVQQGQATNVPSAVTYDAATRRTTLKPVAALMTGTTYVATVKGGTDGVKDLAGNTLVTDVQWSFTTAAAPPLLTPPGAALGGAVPTRTRCSRRLFGRR